MPAFIHFDDQIEADDSILRAWLHLEVLLGDHITTPRG